MLIFSLSQKEGDICSKMNALIILIGLIVANIQCSLANQHQEGPNQAAQTSALQYFKELQQSDTCGAIYTSKLHGYDLREFKIITKDNYEITLHRLIHPEDFATQGPQARSKKPYLLLHGLVGTSASYLVNINDQYLAPKVTYRSREAAHNMLKHKADAYEFRWQSMATKENKAWEGENVDKWGKRRSFAHLNDDIDMDGDQLAFGKEFRQAYRKFDLPKDAYPLLSNSLAMTLSNFGYDVWLLNLRGNTYSRQYNGRLSADHTTEYWDFNIQDVVREDLLASVNFVQRHVECTEPVGLISYSYNNIHILNLLKTFPAYQDKLQPVVMLAPTLLTGQADRGKSKYVMKTLTKVLVSKNGPWPLLGRSFSENKLEYALCKLPIASRLCRLFEIVLNGQSQKVKSVSGLIGGSLWADRKEKLIRRDIDCGQTSKQVLHQIIENLNSQTIHPNYVPFEAARMAQMRGKKNHRRSVIMMHSTGDEISTKSEVRKIRDDALRTMALVDYEIDDADFGHTDFLFSRRNQYLVNAEVIRMAIVYDYLLYKSSVNRPIEVARGF